MLIGGNVGLLKDNEFEDKMRKKFKNNEINISLTHSTAYSNIFIGNNMDKKVELFNMLFNLAPFKIFPKGEQIYKDYAGECMKCGKQIIFLYNNDKYEISDFVYK